MNDKKFGGVIVVTAVVVRVRLASFFEVRTCSSQPENAVHL
jgi:hypothetical protein